MRWRLLFALIGLSITGVSPLALSSFAQGPPQAEGLDGHRRSSPDGEGHRRSSPDGEDLHADYFKPTGVVRFQMVHGRIRLDEPRHRKGSQSRTEHGIYEKITVTADRGIPSVHYLCQTPRQDLSVNVQDAHHLRIESQVRTVDGRLDHRCTLDQPPGGVITLETSQSVAGSKERYRSNNLLHLRLQSPDLFDLHFGNVIARMLHGRSLKELSQQTLQAVIDESIRPVMLDQAKIESLIVALDHPKRRNRMMAQRELLSHGTPIVPLLNQSLDHDRLTVQQRASVEALLIRLTPRVPDRPATLAKMLVNDLEYWEAIVPQLTFAQRELADVRFAALGRETTLVSRSEPATRVAER